MGSATDVPASFHPSRRVGGEGVDWRLGREGVWVRLWLILVHRKLQNSIKQISFS